MPVNISDPEIIGKLEERLTREDEARKKEVERERMRELMKIARQHPPIVRADDSHNYKVTDLRIDIADDPNAPKLLEVRFECTLEPGSRPCTVSLSVYHEAYGLTPCGGHWNRFRNNLGF